MQEQQTTSNMPESPADEKGTPPAMVPYERFAEVNRQLKAARSELAELKDAAGQDAHNNGQNPSDSGEPPSMEEIFQHLMDDPEGYLRELMNNVAQKELQLLREELELKSALQLAQQKYPEFKSFQQHILQELMGLVDEDPDAVSLPWPDLLDRGYERLQARFQEAMQNLPEQLAQATAEDVGKAFVEGNAPRRPQPLVPSYTRQDIARMSLQEFLENEAAINEALKNNRIR